MFKRIVSSRRFKLYLPWAAAAILLAGIGAVLIVYVGNTAPKQAQANGPVIHYKPKPKTVPLPNEARHVAGEFILTAVTRKNLREAWYLTNPNGDVRQGLTLKQWLKGDISVVPYPAVSTANFKVDYSHRNAAQIELLLVPKKGSSVHPQQFLMGLSKYRGHWTVDHWQSLGGPGVPAP